MKKHRFIILAMTFGLCAGFALCYVCLVFPHREGKAGTPALQRVRQQEKTTITIARDGSLYLAGERLDPTQLASRLKQVGAQQPVLIRADRSTDYKRVIEVMDACKAAAVSGVSIVATTTQ